MNSGFFDEVLKLAASKTNFTQTRKGRRPMRVDTMLRKDNEGTLLKHKLGVAQFGDITAEELADPNNQRAKEWTNQSRANAQLLDSAYAKGGHPAFLKEIRRQVKQYGPAMAQSAGDEWTFEMGGAEKLSSAIGVQMVDGQKKVLNEQESEEMMAGIQDELSRISESLPRPDAIFKGLQGLFNPEAEEAEEKVANGGDDEEGRTVLTAEDKAAIKAYMKSRPKGEADKEFHGLVEDRHINPHSAEEFVYDTLGSKLGEAGTAETYLPWYGAALGGTGGALLGEKVVPKKYRTLGMLGGAALGTGAGLHPAVALGRAIDKSRDTKEAMVKAAVGEEVPTGWWEGHLPWYTSALGGATGAVVGSLAAPTLGIDPNVGMIGGTLLGTGLGLHPGEALGRAIDKKYKTYPESAMRHIRQHQRLEQRMPEQVQFAGNTAIPKLAASMVEGAKKEVLSKGVEPTAEVRVRMKGEVPSLVELLKNIHARGAPGHSFGIYEAENGKAQGECLGGWDGDGSDRIVSIESIPLEAKKEAEARRAAELLSSLARKKGIDPKHIGAIRQVENVAGTGQRGRAAEIAKNVRGYLKAASAWSKLADSSKVQWLELPYTEGERGMQNAPVQSKRKPGDMPTVDSDAMNGPVRYDAGWSPPQSAIPSKTAAAAMSKAISSTLIDDDPSDAPDRETPNPNRIQHMTDRPWFVGSAPDAKPITSVESDSAYERD